MESEKSTSWIEKGIWLFALAYALFHLYTAAFGVFQSIVQRSIHVGGAVILFMLLSIQKRLKQEGQKNKAVILLELLMAAYVAFGVVYLISSYDRIMDPLFEITKADIIIGLIFTVIVIETTRRLMGWAIPILAVLFIAYAFLGKYFGGIWQHNGVGVDYVAEILFFSDRGLWGLVTGISASMIAVFMIFGGILFATGGGKSFIDLACRVTGASYGGAGKLAAVASGLFGMISGSAAANVATTGAFTIPLMKRLGYAKEFAGGVESSASSGGQIMPPIMGAAAFIMADSLAIPYNDIALAALIPSLLFYFGVIVSIHYEAKRMNYRGLPADEIPSWHDVFYWKSSIPIFVPLGVLIYYFILGYTPVSCAMRALTVAAVLYLAMDVKDIPHRIYTLLDALVDASKDMLPIVALIATAQIILAMIGLTGIGIKFTNIIIALGHQSIILSGICAMAGTMLLGMGLPTVAAYLVAAAVMAPALIKLGVAPIAAHFFIFYYSIFAGITPPVCGTVFVGAAIAQADWLKTAWVAMRLSIGAYLVPFMMILSPALLLVGNTGEIIESVCTSTLGIFALSAGGMGYFRTNLNWYERTLFCLGGLLLAYPGIKTDLAGAACFILGVVLQFARTKKVQPTA